MTNPGKEFSTVMKTLLDVLEEAKGWISAQDAFRSCGIGDGATTDVIEAVYAELRVLERSKRVAVEQVRDSQGQKTHDRLKLIART